MAQLISRLVTHLNLDERLQANSLKRSALQCSMAAVVVLLLLLVLDTVTQTVLIAALGASAFIAFAVPRSMVSSPRCLVGGYLVGIIAGSSMATLNILLGLSTFLDGNLGNIIFGALAMGLAMFTMLVTRTEHPPAAALALGLVLNEWTSITLVLVIIAVIALSLCKQLVLPHLLDLL
jgi:CBS domain-containing membrane protein